MLERRIVQVKLLKGDKAALKEAVKIAEKIEGVVSATAADGIVSAEIGEWASDYDVMVAIINGIDESLHLEAEPFMNDDLPADVSETGGDLKAESDKESGERLCDNGKLTAGKTDEKADDEETQNPKKDWIFKISEWGVAFILFIVGLILAGGEKSYKAAPYLQILAFTVAGYEVCFSMLSKIFKKNFISEEAFITLTAIAAVVLQKYEYAASFMIIYGGLQVAIDGVKLFALKGEAEYFKEADENRKIKKIVDVYTVFIFISILAYAFVSPAFSESYKTAIKSSGFMAVLLAAALCPFSVSAIRALTLAFALKSVRLNGVKTSVRTIALLGKAKSVLFDINAAEKGGAPTEDLGGAVLELYDGGIENAELLSGGDKAHCIELRKQLNMRKSASMLTSEGMIDEIKLVGGKNKTAVYVTAENNAVLSSGAAGVTIGLGAAECDAVIKSGDVKKIPYLIKLAKRTRKLSVVSGVIACVVKAALVALILTKFTDNAYLACGLSAAASLVGLVISLINRTEVN